MSELETAAVQAAETIGEQVAEKVEKDAPDWASAVETALTDHMAQLAAHHGWLRALVDDLAGHGIPLPRVQAAMEARSNALPPRPAPLADLAGNSEAPTTAPDQATQQ